MLNIPDAPPHPGRINRIRLFTLLGKFCALTLEQGWSCGVGVQGGVDRPPTAALDCVTDINTLEVLLINAEGRTGGAPPN